MLFIIDNTIIIFIIIIILHANFYTSFHEKFFTEVWMAISSLSSPELF